MTITNKPSPATTADGTSSPRFLPALLILILLALCLLGIVDHDLWTADEPRVACLSHTMFQTHEWAVPRLAGEIFIEKPPLYFWLCGATGRLLEPLFGFVGAARLSVSLCAIGTIAATAWLGFLLWGRRRAAWASALVLGVMPQFLIEMHWMRVDVLLAFCVVASVAFLVLAYRHCKPWALLPAGIFAAGAFLSKGPIGWILIGVGAVGLVLPALLASSSSTKDSGKPSPGPACWISAHLFAIFLCLFLAGLWVWKIWIRDDPSAWNAWFWDNQIGRTTGTAGALGHHHPWNVFYYVNLLPIVLGPWIPFLLVWFFRRAADAWKARRSLRAHLDSPTFFIAMWGLGDILLLTIPSTKRGLYLLPLFPAFALMVVDAFHMLSARPLPKFFRVWTGIWEMLIALAAVALLLVPVVGRYFFDIPVLVHWNSYYTFSLVVCLLAAFFACRYRARLSIPLRLFFANAFLWMLIYGVPFQAIDAGKSMRDATLRMADALPSSPDARARIAAYHLDETTRAALEFYAGIVLPRLPVASDFNGAPLREESQPMIARILKNQHPDFSGVLAFARRDTDKIWPADSERICVHLSKKRHLYYLTPAPADAEP